MSWHPRLHERFLTPAARRVTGFAVIAAAACTMSTEVDPATNVAAVSITPPTTTVSVGSQVPLQALVQDASGKSIADAHVFWSVQDPSVATISSTGIVTGMGIGTTEIAASVDGKSGIATITVQKAPVASVVVTPPHVDIAPGGKVQLTAALYDAAQNALSGRAITWSTSTATVATVDANGMMTAVATGSATITATAEGKTGVATITVTQAAVASVVLSPTPLSMSVGQTTQLAATLTDSSGNVLTGRTVTWASSNNASATVSDQGVVTAVAEGTATITATSEGKSGTAAVTVSNVAVGSVTVQPQAPTFVAGLSVQLTATVRDVNGLVVTGRVVTWASSNSNVASVSTTGLVTGVTAGTATITATSEGKSGTTAVTVTPVPVGSVALSPATASIRVTATTTLTPTVKDANGTVVTNRVIIWSSSDTTVATVVGGVVTGAAPGTATITATSEGKSGTASVTVSKIPVGSVTVSPTTKSLLVTQTVALSTTVKDSVGNVVTDRVVTWGSDNAAVATVSPAGLVTAVAPGTATITATSETKSGTSTITVALVPVSTVVVQPTQDTLFVNGTAQLTAVTKDSIGDVLSGRTIAWGSTNTAVANVSATTGLVTAVAPGTTSITATSEGKIGASGIVVLQIPVASVTITPTTATILSGTTTTFTAVTKDAQGNVLTGRTITWNSSNTGEATVSSSGPATGLATSVANLAVSGTTTITATSEGQQSNGATLTVNPAPVATVTITPTTATIASGGTTSFTAVTKDAQGNVLTGRTITWNSTNTAAATVNGSGVATGVSNLSASATTTITATSEGQQSNGATLTVSPVPVASVTITPTSVTILSGTTTTFTAVTKDGGGNVLTGRTITWASSNTSAATVSSSGPSTGLATGVVNLAASGTTTITATSEGQQSNGATLTVNPAPVATVTITPTTATIASGGTTTFTAVTKDAGGNVLTGRTITWASSNTSAATVSSSGPSTGLAAGVANLATSATTTITATSEAQQSNGATLTVSPVPVATVTISPATATIASGGTTTFTAVTKDAGGNVLTGRTITWASSNTGAATVSSSGPSTGLATGVVNLAVSGTTTITATSEGQQSNSATLTVNPAPVATVTVTPTTATIASGGTTTFTAVTKDAGGNVLTGRTITWSSSNALAATVSSSGPSTGLASGVANLAVSGTTTITAMSEGQQSNGATLTVNPVPVATVAITPTTATILSGATTTFTAVTKDAGGNVLTGRTITWSSSNALAATVSSSGPSTGLASGVANLAVSGTTTITAMSEGQQSNGASLTVNPVPVATVTISPTTATISSGATTTFTAVTKDAGGNVLTGRTITWASSNTGAATVSSSGPSTGLATGVANLAVSGATTITATSEGQQSNGATLTVNPVPVASVTITPTSVTILSGTTTTFTAVTKDAQGNVLTGRTITWNSTNTAAATVNGSGVATGASNLTVPGSTTISATSEGQQSNDATLTVNPVPVASVTIAPPSPDTVLIGYTTQLSATTKDSIGGVLTGRTVTWQSDNTAAATVNSSTGLVTGVAAGTANISATSEGKSISVTMVSTIAPVGSVVVAPASDSVLATGGTAQLTATVRDVKGTVVTDRTITWTSTQPTANVSPSTGADVTVTGVSPGPTSIVAMAETKSGSSSINVLAAVASVQIAPGSATLSLATSPTVQLTATCLDGSNAPIAGRKIQWSSSDPTIATVDANGLVTAKAAGTASISATAVLDGVTSSVAAQITVTP